MPKRTLAVVAALALIAGAIWTWAALDGGRRPFTLTVFGKDGSARRLLVYDLDPVRARRWAPSAPSHAQWEGTIEPPRGHRGGDTYEVSVAATSPTRLALGTGADGLEHPGRGGRVTQTFALDGVVKVTVVHALREDAETSLRVAVARGGGAPERFEALCTRRSKRLDGLRPWAGSAALLSAAGVLLGLALHLRRAPPETRARLARRAAHAAAALVTLYAAVLRLEALASKYEAPAWASRVVPVAQELHARGMKWLPPEHPYLGDPFSYLRLARDMGWFYEASVREPVFVFATKQMLALTSDRDVAVSLASGLFSTLLVPATYLLGVAAFTPGAGLAAAAALAVERQAIGLGVDGWRDDAFAFFVVASAAAVVRLRRRPAWRTSLGAGVALGLALLTRVTALSFAVPALILAAWDMGGAPRRWRPAAAAGAVALLLLAPFLLTCALEYGDPLYSINAHTRFYRSRAAGTHEEASGIQTMLAERGGPWTLLDTAAVGLTAYPFTSKWEHFDYLGTWIGPVLAAAALAGLLLWAFSPEGRLLLAILLSSLVPFAFTWEVPGGSEWRFTLHAYPFYLLAAGSVPWLLVPIVRRGRPRARVLAMAVAAAAALYVAACGLLWARVREEIGGGRAARLAVSYRDAFFFGEGWSRPTRAGHVLVRHAEAHGASVRVPLRAGRPYRLVLRLDPDAAHAQATITLNGLPLGDLTLARDGTRLGRYELAVPAFATRDGANTLRFRATAPIRLWLLQVEPR